MTRPSDLTAPQSPQALAAADLAAARAEDEPTAPLVSHVTQIESGAWGARATCACRGWGAEFLVGRHTVDGEAIYSETKAVQLATNAAFCHREAMR
jgi:hypothetical protein